MFDWFIKIHIKKLEKQVGPFDLVWSFDLTNAMPLSCFSNKSKKIFFAADWPLTKDALKAAEGASLLVSVAQEILDQYSNKLIAKKLLINHGVADCFIEEGKKPFVRVDDVIRIGMSGNFLRPDIDRPVLLEIINTHTDLIFECFGSYEFKNSNLGGSADADTIAFIDALQHAPNVILHGMLRPEVLAKELHRMDAFLICYDVKKDQSKGTNYHKVMENLAYGKLIVSNDITDYADNSSILQPQNSINQSLTIVEIFKNMLIDQKKHVVKSNLLKNYSELLLIILS